MDFYRANILTIVTFFPLAGAIVLLFLNKENKNLIKLWANIVGMVGFLISIPLWLWFDFDKSDQFQFGQVVPWIKALGADYRVGIDGISLLLIMLTTLLGALAILSSWSAIEMRVKEYYIFLLLLQVGMLGVFISLDFFMFYVFWEVMLVPMYFLIGVWGGPRKLYAAIKFFLYTLVGSVLMLLGIIALYFLNGRATGIYTFGYTDIVTSLTSGRLLLTPATELYLFLAFFLAF